MPNRWARPILHILAVVLVGAAAAPRARAQPSPAPEPAAGGSTGAWPDTVPIEVPSTLAQAPHLALIASHTVSDGVLGGGWTLAGGSVITRRSSTGGVPGTTVTDSFVLDGTPLVAVSTPGPSHYQPEVWDGSRLDYDGATNTWTLKKDGWTSTYGTAPGTGANATQLMFGVYGRAVKVPSVYGGSLIWAAFPYAGGSCPNTALAQCNTVAWYLSRVVDPFGNAATYAYTRPAIPTALRSTYWMEDSRQPLLSSIDFAGGNGHVALTYVDRPDVRYSGAAGTPSLMLERLRAIDVTAHGGTFFARYELEYQDEAGTTCAGAPTGAAPRRTLLRRIVRTGAGGAAPRRPLRCLEDVTEAPGWTPRAAAVALGGVVRPPAYGGHANSSAIPLSTNLDGDGITDLVVLDLYLDSLGHHSVDAAAYVATPSAATPFTGAGGTSTASRIATAWQTEIAAALTGAVFDSERGWALIDLERDAWPELLVETSSTVVTAHAYQPRTRTFTTRVSGIAPCDLRNGSFADVDGDGFVDLVRRAHGTKAGCAATTRSAWIRNRGDGTWAAAATLDLPFERATYPADLTARLAACAGGAVAFPDDLDPSWTDAAYLADQSRYVDLNSDGLADLTLAVYGCWKKVDGEWQPVSDSSYSRIYWGDGFGDFLPADLGAGPPLLLDSTEHGGPMSSRRRTSGFFAAVDVDGDGSSEILASALVRDVAVQGGFFQTLATGWGFLPIADSYAGSSGDEVRDFDVMPYVGRGNDCYKHTVTPAIGDFDGDGFVDLLTFELHDEDGGPLCGDHSWCVLLRTNARHDTYGRTTASTDTWGGRTAFTWGFSAQAPHENPDLPINVEVLNAVDGAGGHVSMRYAGGALDDGSPTGFAVTESTNARGGVEVFARALSRPLRGLPVYAARRRTDGSLERVTVYINGTQTPSWGVSLTRPIANPLIRQCDFDVGFGVATWWGGVVQSVDVDDLIATCYRWSNPTAAGGGLLGQVLALIGWDRWPATATPGALIAAQVWGRSGQAPPATITINGTGPEVQRSFELLDHGVTNDRAIGYRWPQPAGVRLPPALAPSAYTNPAGTAITDDKLYVTDWTYGSGHRLDERYDHRDTTTLDDDLVNTFSWNQPDPSGAWYQLMMLTIADATGARLRSTFRADFPFFDLPRLEVHCGVGGTGCTFDHWSYGAAGELLAHTLPDGRTEAWTVNWCGKPLTETDRAGLVTSHAYDDRCLETSRDERGVAVATVYDAFLRITGETIDPDGTGPTTTTTYVEDDDLSIPIDASYLEPRAGERRADGQVSLTYRDEFGRPTRRVTCGDAGPAAGATGVRAAMSCVAGTELVEELELYGTDGEVLASVDPYLPGETAASTGYLRDGAGRVVVEQSPAHGTTPAWGLTRATHYPDRDEQIDPLGRVGVARTSTLEQSRELAGTIRSRRRVDALGQTRWIDAADGTRTTITRDVRHRVAAVTVGSPVACIARSGAAALCSVTRRLDYDAADRVDELIDAEGIVTRYAYDDADRVVSVRVDGTVRETTAYTDATAGAPASATVTDESGATTLSHYDGLGRLLDETRGGLTRTIAWGASGHAIAETDADGLTTTIDNDIHDHVRSLTRPRDGRTIYQVDGGGRVRARIDADGVADFLAYTYSGQPLAVRRGSWLLGSTEYDAAGRAIRRLTGGVEDELDYDDLDRPVEIRRGLDSSGRPTTTERLGYDTGDRTVTRELADATSSTRTSYAYNALGWPTTVTDALGAVVTTQYDAEGRTRTITDEVGHDRSIAYDTLGRAIAVELPGAGTMARTLTPGATWGGLHQLTLEEITDGDGAVTQRYRDALDRPVAVVYPDGRADSWTYAGAQLASEARLDAAGTTVAETRFEYEPGTGRLARRRGPDVPTGFSGDEPLAEWSYTSAGRTSSLTTPDDTNTFAYADGYLASETWSELRRDVLRTDPRAPWITDDELQRGGGPIRHRTFLRDQAGRVVQDQTTDGSGAVETHVLGPFALDGQPLVAVSQLGAVDQVRDEWSYDGDGRPLRRITTTAGAPGQITDWSWFADGTLQEVRTPSGVRLAYDYGTPFDHHLRRVYDPTRAGIDYLTVRTWNGRGQPTGVDLPMSGSSMELRYDGRGRLTGKEIGPPGRPLSVRWLGSYDDLDNLAREDIDDDAARMRWTNTFGYDGAGRLTSEDRGKDRVRWRYTLDRAGRRLITERDDGTGFGVTTKIAYRGAVVDQVNGVALAYDAWDDVVRDQHGNSYERSPSGLERAIVPAGGRPITFTRDVHGVVVQEDDVTGSRLTAWGLSPAGLPLETGGRGRVLAYVTGGGLLAGRLINGVPSSFEDLFVTGGQRAAWMGTRASADGNGFGEGFAPPAGDDDRFGFAALEQVPGAPGVMLARLRTYDAQTGRFLSPDPSGLDGGLHRYTYADGNPLRYDDPMGLSPCTTAGPPPIAIKLPPIPTAELMTSGAKDPFAEMKARLAAMETRVPSLDLEALMKRKNPFGPNPCQTQGCDPAGDDSRPLGGYTGSAVSDDDLEGETETEPLSKEEQREAKRAATKAARDAKAIEKRRGIIHLRLVNGGPISDGDGEGGVDVVVGDGDDDPTPTANAHDTDEQITQPPPTPPITPPAAPEPTAPEPREPAPTRTPPPPKPEPKLPHVTMTPRKPAIESSVKQPTDQLKGPRTNDTSVHKSLPTTTRPPSPQQEEGRIRYEGQPRLPQCTTTPCPRFKDVPKVKSGVTVTAKMKIGPAEVSFNLLTGDAALTVGNETGSFTLAKGDSHVSLGGFDVSVAGDGLDIKAYGATVHCNRSGCTGTDYTPTITIGVAKVSGNTDHMTVSAGQSEAIGPVSFGIEASATVTMEDFRDWYLINFVR